MAVSAAQFYFRFRIWWSHCLENVCIYKQTKFLSYRSIRSWDITISCFEKQTSDIFEFYFRFRFRPYHHRSRHVILHQSAKFHPNRTAHGRKMTSCRFSRWRISAILDFRSPIMGSLKSPCRTSYMSIDIIALNCLVFEKIAFLCRPLLIFGDKQTDKQTYKQMDSPNALITRAKSTIIRLLLPRTNNWSEVTSASDLSLRTIKCCCVVFGVTLRLLDINILSSSSAINKLRRFSFYLFFYYCLLPAMSFTNLPRSGGTMLITPDGRSWQLTMKQVK